VQNPPREGHIYTIKPWPSSSKFTGSVPTIPHFKLTNNATPIIVSDNYSRKTIWQDLKMDAPVDEGIVAPVDEEVRRIG
jgi:hypothetical protein